ncbi:hypothetical protein [Pantoea sp. LMR881]
MRRTLTIVVTGRPLVAVGKSAAHEARRIMQTDMGRVCRVSTPDGERNAA